MRWYHTKLAAPDFCTLSRAGKEFTLLTGTISRSGEAGDVIPQLLVTMLQESEQAIPGVRRICTLCGKIVYQICYRVIIAEPLSLSTCNWILVEETRIC
jgi:hypothetical protein